MPITTAILQTKCQNRRSAASSFSAKLVLFAHYTLITNCLTTTLSIAFVF
jgi:hypothetical protein